jgi:hypothetical protein
MKTAGWETFMECLASDLSAAFPAARVSRQRGGAVTLRYTHMWLDGTEPGFSMTVEVEGGEWISVVVSPGRMPFEQEQEQELAWSFRGGARRRCACMAVQLAEMASAHFYLEALGAEIEATAQCACHDASVSVRASEVLVLFESPEAVIRADFGGVKGGRGLARVCFGPSRVFHPHVERFGSREEGCVVTLPSGDQFEGYEQGVSGRRGGAHTESFFELPARQEDMLAFIQGLTRIVERGRVRGSI